jgi:hypothetical protein
MSVVLCILYFILLWAISSDLEQFILKEEKVSEYFYRNIAPTCNTKSAKLASVSYFLFFTFIILIALGNATLI